MKIFLIIVVSLIVATLFYLGVARETGFNINGGLKDKGLFNFFKDIWAFIDPRLDYKTEVKTKEEKEAYAKAEKNYSSKSLWVCITIGVIVTEMVPSGYGYWGAIALATCLALRSFSLPVTQVSFVLRWIYLAVMFLFLLLPGVHAWWKITWHNLDVVTERFACVTAEACVPQTSPSVATAPTQRVPVKAVLLTSEWTEEIPLPPGKTIRYYCSQPGAEMAVVYDSAQSMSVGSGEIFPCPTQNDSPPVLGTNVVHARYVFRKPDGEGDVTATVTSN